MANIHSKFDILENKSIEEIKHEIENYKEQEY